MTRSAQDVLNREYLEMRAKILELAASRDRIDRAEGNADDDPRMALLRQGFELLLSDQPQRAEQVQLLFSIPYDRQWRETLAVVRRF